MWCSSKSNSIWEWESCFLCEFSLSNNYMSSLRTTACDALIVPSDFSTHLIIALFIYGCNITSSFVVKKLLLCTHCWRNIHTYNILYNNNAIFEFQWRSLETMLCWYPLTEDHGATYVMMFSTRTTTGLVLCAKCWVIGLYDCKLTVKLIVLNT